MNQIDPSKMPGNSNTQKAKAKAEPPRVKKIIQGEAVQREPSLGRRVRESFTGDDSKTVGNYLLFDVIIPQGKDLLSNLVAQGVERLLFGEVRGRRVTGGNRTSYSAISSSSGATYSTVGGTPAPDRRPVEIRTRTVHSFEDLVFENRGEAQVVLDGLIARIDDYGVATVTDLYDFIGATSQFTDNNWGWKSLHGARVVRDRGGFFIDLPKTIPLS